MGAALLSGAAFWLYRRYERSHRFVFVPNDVAVTIPEGTNIADLDALLVSAGAASKSFLLDREYLSLEGKLFPDTYRFERNSSPSAILMRFRENYEFRTSGIAVTEDAIIIASLLEKEVRTEQDMRLVSGIIQKRRSVGMPLQIDAAVAYGACYDEFVRGRYCDVSDVNLVDNIRRDSAYNTYTRAGLPAGPISNPGLAAIRAALNPQTSEYWFYLSARDGTTIFSKTLEEHNRAKAKYLR